MDAKELELKLEPLFENSNYEIVDVRIFRGKKLVVQIFIDKKNGSVTLDDCEKWSEKVGSFIDMNSLIESSYILEISSPGVDRIIKKPADFIRFKGYDVKIKLKRPVDGTKIYYSKIVDFKDNTVFFEDNLSFNMDDIEEVRLNPDDKDLLKKIK